LVCWKPVWSRLKLQPTCLESSCLCRVFVYLVLVSGEPGDCGLGLSHWDVSWGSCISMSEANQPFGPCLGHFAAPADVTSAISSVWGSNSHLVVCGAFTG
jgi:hypothetical protein